MAPRDALDVYIQHRNVMEDRVTGSQSQGQQSQQQQPGQQQQRRNVFPPELMRRYEVHLRIASCRFDPYWVVLVVL